MKHEVLNSIETLDIINDYWFIRTDGGKHFDTFFENDFIGIGWNEISVSDLSKTEIEVKNKIAKNRGLDLKITSDKTKATDIYHKILRLQSLKRNDVIIIPSENSRKLAFGLIDDDFIFEDIKGSHDCEYEKRRRVKWVVEPVSFDSLDDVFYKIRKSRHSISNINDYADHVDSVMYSIYKKKDASHFVVNVKSTGQINWLELANVLKDMHELMSKINSAFSLGENIEDSSIQISIQSPGLFNLRQKGIALVLLATTLGASSCVEVKGNLSDKEKIKLEQFEKDNQEKIKNINSKLRNMDVDL